MSANDINAGRIHFDCGTAMITRMTLIFIFITVSFFSLVCCVRERPVHEFISRYGRSALRSTDH